MPELPNSRKLKSKDAKTRANRKAAGFVPVMVNVPPDMLARLDEAWPGEPRARALLKSAAIYLGTDAEAAAAGRKTGRPRRRVLHRYTLDPSHERFGKGRYIDKGIILRRDEEDTTTVALGYLDFERESLARKHNGKRGEDYLWLFRREDADRFFSHRKNKAIVKPFEQGPYDFVELKVLDIPGDGYQDASIIYFDIAATVRRSDGNFRPVRQFWDIIIRSALFFHYEDDDRGRAVSITLDQEAADQFLREWRENGATVTRRKALRADREHWRAEIVTYRYEIDGWLATLNLNADNPLHRVIEPQLEKRRRLWNESYTPEPVHFGTKQLRQTDLITALDRLASVGVLARDVTEPRLARSELVLDVARVPGWDDPAANGYRLYPHQRKAVEFFGPIRGRGIVGDEMGLGKTASAIAILRAHGARRRLIICPKSAKPVWIREIQGWRAAGTPEDMVRTIDGLDDARDLPDDGWVLATYESITPRSETIAVSEKSAIDVLTRAVTDDPCITGPRTQDGKVKFTIAPEKDGVPIRDDTVNALRDLSERKALSGLAGVASRLTGPNLLQLREWEPDAVVVDEAHRIKDPQAARTKVVRTLTLPRDRLVLLLSGTPLRNHQGDGVELIRAFDPGSVAAAGTWAARAGRTERRMATKETVNHLLRNCMIRRLKRDLLDLPEKIRVEVAVELDPITVQDIMEMVAEGNKIYREAIGKGVSKREAHQLRIERYTVAAHICGRAKVESTVEKALEVLEEKPAILIFARFLDVIEAIERELVTSGISVVKVTGKTSLSDRKSAEEGFQAGKYRVFLGQVQASGEAITLTRADTVIFNDLGWVPGELEQAEDRGHRMGQLSEQYLIYRMVAANVIPELNIDTMMLKALSDKTDVIVGTLGDVLGRN